MSTHFALDLCFISLEACRASFGEKNETNQTQFIHHKQTISLFDILQYHVASILIFDVCQDLLDSSRSSANPHLSSDWICLSWHQEIYWGTRISRMWTCKKPHVHWKLIMTWCTNYAWSWCKLQRFTRKRPPYNRCDSACFTIHIFSSKWSVLQI